MVLVSMDVIVDIKELIANKVESILNISKKKTAKICFTNYTYKNTYNNKGLLYYLTVLVNIIND